MEIKSKMCDTQTWKIFYFSTYLPQIMIRLSHRFFSASKPAAKKSFHHCLSHFHTSVSTSLSSVSWPSCEPLYVTDTSHRKQKILLYEYQLHSILLPTNKTHKRTLLFCSTPVKHDRYSDYWNQPLSMRMCVRYLDCHEAGPCCYLMIHIETLLCPLQLFYFLLWPIYWRSLVYCMYIEEKTQVYCMFPCARTASKTLK
jgi:hypothetical protein